MPKGTTYRQGKKRRMTKFVINELSAVDFPAQEGARALILKRRDVDKHYCGDCDEERAIVLLTSAEDGHTHALWIHLSTRGGETSYGLIPDADTSHDHPWILDGTGRITIGENNGHAHTVDPQQIFEMIMNKDIQKRAVLVSSARLWDDYAIKFTGGSKEPDPEDTMPEPTKEELAIKAAADSEAKLTTLEGKLVRAGQLAELTDVQKVHLNSLDEAGQTEYLGKSAEEREAVITKSADDDPVVYTDGNGDDFHKSDDPRLVRMAKERDSDRKRLAKTEALREQDTLEKRADSDLPNLPGDTKVRAAVLKAVDGIEDEELRKAAHESVQAGDKAIKAAFQNLGGAGGGASDAGDAEAELERLAKERAKKENENYFDAYDVVAKANPELAKRAVDGN